MPDRRYPIPGRILQLYGRKIIEMTTSENSSQRAFVLEDVVREGKVIRSSDVRDSNIAMTPAYFGWMKLDQPEWYGDLVVNQPRPWAREFFLGKAPPRAVIIREYRLHGISEFTASDLRSALISAKGTQLAAQNIWVPLITSSLGVGAARVGLTCMPATFYTEASGFEFIEINGNEFEFSWEFDVPQVEEQLWVGREVLFIHLVHGNFLSISTGNTAISTTESGGDIVSYDYVNVPWQNVIDAGTQAMSDTFNHDIFYRKMHRAIFVNYNSDTYDYASGNAVSNATYSALQKDIWADDFAIVDGQLSASNGEAVNLGVATAEQVASKIAEWINEFYEI